MSSFLWKRKGDPNEAIKNPKCEAVNHYKRLPGGGTEPWLRNGQQTPRQISKFLVTSNCGVSSDSPFWKGYIQQLSYAYPITVFWAFERQKIGLFSSQVSELRLSSFKHSKSCAQGVPSTPGPHVDNKILDVKFML